MEFDSEKAIKICEHEVRDQSIQQLNSADVRFESANLDQTSGRTDWVTGTFVLGPDRDPDHIFQFACSVNANSSRVRSLRVDPTPTGAYSADVYAGLSDDAVQRCEARVQDRLARSGYDYIKFGYIDSSQTAWRNDRVSGVARAYRGGGFDSYDFACSIDAGSGSVNSFDLKQR
jgi:hypothetical protein